MTSPSDAQAPMGVLWISHDGALDPLGQSQVLPYMLGLSGSGQRLTLLSFEKPAALADPARVARVEAACRAANIRWVPLTYHRWPPVVSTLWDMVRGFWTGWRLIRQERIQVIHARSYVPACLGTLLKQATGARMIFDMRELWVDGRVDGGSWRRGGWLHRIGKRCERWCLCNADGVVSLTETGKRIVEGFPYWRADAAPIAVIPTCVDTARFQAPARTVSGRTAPVIVYLGSVGTWYRLDAMADCYRAAAAQWPGSRFLIVTPHADAARAVCLARGLRPEQFDIRSLPHEDVPQGLEAADIALYFITPSYAKQSSCPTKLGESLAAGLPIMTNAGIGDQDALIRAHRVGVVVEELTPAAYARAWTEMAALLAEGDALHARCREVAERELGLGRALRAYTDMYHHVAAA